MEVQPPTGAGRRFVLHAFNCTTGTDCPVGGQAEALHKALKAATKEAGVPGVRINNSGCLDQCGHGPMLVVYPEGIWYSHLQPGDAKRIVEEHFVGGIPVADLMYASEEPGKNKLPKVPGEPPDKTHPSYKPCARCNW